MRKQIIFWQAIASKLHAGADLMLLIVADSSGSSPGRPGFKMIVGPDEYLLGSIGGGIMEIKLTELARKILAGEDDVPLIKQQIHNKAAAKNQSGMICSGEQTVLYFKLTSAHLPEIEKLVASLVDSHLSNFKVSYVNTLANLEVTGAGDEKNIVFEKINDVEFTYSENIGYQNKIYIVGGGHCSLALCDLLSRFDFYIHVIEDRAELNTLTQNEFAHEKHILATYSEIEKVILSDPGAFVVVMTLGYRSDIEVLQQLSGKSFAYLGLLGSEAKVIRIKEELALGGYPEKQLNEMHAPIGMRIQSHTPEEIAISIMAEIINVRNKLSEKPV